MELDVLRDWSVEEDIDRLTRGNRGNDGAPVYVLRVSTLAHVLDDDGGIPCMRRAVFEVALRRYRLPYADEMLASFAKGDEEEQCVAQRLVKSNRPVRTAQEEHSDGATFLPVKGHTDFWVFVGDRWWLAECKSVGPSEWGPIIQALANGGSYLCERAYVRAYPRQLRLYLGLSGQDAGVLLYSRRDTLKMAKEVIEADRDWYGRVMEESVPAIRSAVTPVLDGIRTEAPDSPAIRALLPPYPDDRAGLDCFKCPYREFCEAGYRFEPRGEFLADPEAWGLYRTWRSHEGAAKAAKTAWEALEERIKMRLAALDKNILKWEYVLPDASTICGTRVRPKGKKQYWLVTFAEVEDGGE